MSVWENWLKVRKTFRNLEIFFNSSSFPHIFLCTVLAVKQALLHIRKHLQTDKNSYRFKFPERILKLLRHK